MSAEKNNIIPPYAKSSANINSEATRAVDNEYRRILVIGANKTGKTSLLSTAVGGDFSRTYRLTGKCEKYVEPIHQLELVDTPGLDDTILNGTKDTAEPSDFEQVRRHYQEFRDDSVVQELICDPKERGKHSNMLIDVDVTQIDAYLIVYTDDDRSKRVAKALRLAILSKRISDNRKLVFFLPHVGDFGTLPMISRVNINDETRHVSKENNAAAIELVFRDDVPIASRAYAHPSLKMLPYVSAQSGEGLSDVLAIIRNEIDQVSGGMARPRGKTAGRGLRAALKSGEIKPAVKGPVILPGAVKKPVASTIDAPLGGHTDAPLSEDERKLMGGQRPNNRANCTSMAAAGCSIA